MHGLIESVGGCLLRHCSFGHSSRANPLFSGGAARLVPASARLVPASGEGRIGSVRRSGPDNRWLAAGIPFNNGGGLAGRFVVAAMFDNVVDACFYPRVDLVEEGGSRFAGDIGRGGDEGFGTGGMATAGIIDQYVNQTLTAPPSPTYGSKTDANFADVYSATSAFSLYSPGVYRGTINFSVNDSYSLSVTTGSHYFLQQAVADIKNTFTIIKIGTQNM